MQWEYARHNDPWTKRAICDLCTPCDEGHAKCGVENDAREEERSRKDSIGAETGADACTGQYERWDLHVYAVNADETVTCEEELTSITAQRQKM